MTPFNGLGMHLGNLWHLSSAQTRSISPEQMTGAKGLGGMALEGTGAHAARDLGQGWKISPSIAISTGEESVLADIQAGGAIQHIWMALSKLPLRQNILRIYWDDTTVPSVECPVGDFFACGWNQYAQISSLAVCVNPGIAFNCYWEMPFRQRCRITLSNIGDEPIVVYYQITYTITDIPDDAAYFHAQFRRVNPLPYKAVYTILDDVRGQGQYVGTYLAWGVNNAGWWGEGEIKFYLDGDDDFPTICGTGTEDYFCGSWNFDVGKEHGGYREFTTPYSGLSEVIRPDGLYQSQTRFSMYRWHITDPIRFQADLRVTIQALGWRSERRYLPLQDDIASVAYWYQTLPSTPFPPLPDRDALEII
ncbi:MAG: DUF2961 domain-containing protein [Roseiflexaceae bacterium]|nr:DUF2961 domain-containing protein [Roseiflexaceae bacterium]